MEREPQRTSYDDVPYPSYPLPQTHPSHLATVATLLGLQPPPPERCRVLELGCGTGANLIPMALSFSESNFVGVDLSERQIHDGQQIVEALCLGNIDLRQASILEVDESWGFFDYIICHGVYSWVPPEVQDKILEILHRQLTPNGIGYVSYNTHPGWHQWGVIRKMMRFHVDRRPDSSPQEQIQQARKLLEFLARATPFQDRSYALLLREQLDLLRGLSDAYLFHEHLEEHNEPVWFLDFCDRLAAHDLRFLSESDFSAMVATTAFPQDIREELESFAPKLLEKEQYMDFVRNRTFRQTLVCHDSQQPSYDVRANRVITMHIASPLCACSETPDLISNAAEEFTTPDGRILTTPQPIVKAALVCLASAWPQFLTFDELLTRARNRLGQATDSTGATFQEEALDLARSLLTAYASSNPMLVELSIRPPQLAATPGDFPTVSLLARIQAVSSRFISNLRHETVGLTSFDQHLVPLLDGMRNRDELIEALLPAYEAENTPTPDSETSPSEADFTSRDRLGKVIGERLAILAKLALFVGELSYSESFPAVHSSLAVRIRR